MFMKKDYLPVFLFGEIFAFSSFHVDIKLFGHIIILHLSTQ